MGASFHVECVPRFRDKGVPCGCIDGRGRGRGNDLDDELEQVRLQMERLYERKKALEEQAATSIVKSQDKAPASSSYATPRTGPLPDPGTPRWRSEDVWSASGNESNDEKCQTGVTVAQVDRTGSKNGVTKKRSAAAHSWSSRRATPQTPPPALLLPGVPIRPEANSSRWKDEDDGEASFCWEEFQDFSKEMSIPNAVIEEPLPVALLFGDQAPSLGGMLQETSRWPAAQALVQRANEVLGYDLEALCGATAGRAKPELERPKYCQAAVYVAGIAAAARLRVEQGEAVARCQAVAGVGVGELAALQVAGVFDFELGLRLAEIRAKEMQRCALASGHQFGHLSLTLITGAELDRVRALCAEANRACGDDNGVCSVAYAVAPKGHICAGTRAAARQLYRLCHDDGHVRASVMDTPQPPGHGAFQTRLMEEAQARLRVALREAIPKMRPPRCAVYFNAMGEALPAGTEPSLVAELLAEQLTNTALWEPTIRTMLREGIEEFVICGASTSTQLKDSMSKISPEASTRTITCTV